MSQARRREIRHNRISMRAWVLIAILPFALAACASAPQSRPGAAPTAPGARAATYALKMVGRAYRPGGSSPETGFDCSGLVQFSYRQAGLAVPRSTEEQRRAGAVVRVANLRRGDVLFFHQEGKRNSHVGIYLGNGEFVHAPSSGKRVRSDRFDSPYWKKHFSEARRFAI
jgi:murein DD-endopeptidase